MRKSPEELLQHSPSWAKDYVLGEEEFLPPRISDVVEFFLSWKDSSISQSIDNNLTAFSNICDQKELNQADRKRAWKIIVEKL